MSSMLRTIRRRAEREGHVRVPKRVRSERGKRRRNRFEARLRSSRAYMLDPRAALKWMALAMRRQAQ